jgi:hypothetical protein
VERPWASVRRRPMSAFIMSYANKSTRRNDTIEALEEVSETRLAA